MIGSVIEQMFYGKKGTLEAVKFTQEHCKNSLAVCQAYERLSDRLGKDLLPLFKSFVDEMEASNAADALLFYKEGFKLGVLVGVECVD